MEMFNSTLKSEDVKFFYRVLYQYEKEGTGRHTGYSYKGVPLEIRRKVSLEHDTRKSKIELNFPVKPNSILYKGIGVCSPLLKHLRHSFAHACIEREGEYYIINSQVNSKCQICGKVKRTDLMNLVNGYYLQKKKIIKNREMRNFTFKGLFLAIVFIVLGSLSIQAADDDGLITKQVTVKVYEAGTLSEKIAYNKRYKITNLKIIGDINGTDLRMIREMAGRDVNGRGTDGMLSVLDLLDAKVVEGGDYYYDNNWHHDTFNNVIGDFAFRDCSGLTSLTLPSGVTVIGSYAFSGCSGLTSLTLPSGLTRIGSYVFFICSGLTSLTLPSGVTEIGEDAFSGCSGLTSLTLPSGVTEIGSSAFSGCSGLTSLTLPSGLTRIGSSAFSGCSGLTSITLPSGVTKIGSGAFHHCSGLTSIYVYAGKLPNMGSDVFDGCDVKKCTVYVPKGTYDDYWLSEFGYFENIVEFDPTGIKNVITSNDAKELYRYSVNGQSLSAPAKGLNIVKYSDGSVKKVAVQ